MAKREGSADTKPECVNPHDTTVFLENVVRRTLSSSRFLHSRHTALLARDLCLRFNLDPAAGYLAGIAHDICKSMDDDELVRLALADGSGRSSLEKKKPRLLHGRAAAIFLRDHCYISDDEILNAIACHVTGSMDMGSLAKILYIADKIEVSRDWVPPGIREMCVKADLEELFAAVLQDNVSFLRSRQLEIAEGTQGLLATMGIKPDSNMAEDNSK